MKTKQETDFEALSGVQQVLLRPGMWAGSMQIVKQKMFIINHDGVEYKEVEFVPAFLKIISEILDNSTDALVKYSKGKGRVKVVIDEDCITIEDNGPGIPVIRKELKDIKDTRMTDEEKKRISETYLPEIAWTRLFSGSNFKDSDDKTTVGSHGLGSKLTAIFSKKFVGVSDDGKKVCKVVAKDNLEKVDSTISDSKGESGVKVKFTPDFARFGLTKVEDVYKELVYQRLMCLGITFPGIKFSFNGKNVNVNDKTFLNLFSKNITFQVFDRGFIGVYPNEQDDFNFFTYVDGLALNRGGSHIDYIIDKVVVPIREKLVKKYKTIKPADIKNRLSMVVFLRDFPNLKFDSQTKETLTNLPSEITKYFGDSVDFEKLVKNIGKNEFIMDPIVETFKLKEEVKERVALKQAGKSKVKVDATKYIPPTGNSKKYFLITEGASACGGLAQALGRNGIAYYAGRGVPLNVWDCGVSAMVKNKEFVDITSILGLDPSKNDNKCLNFDKVVFANDADCLEEHTEVLTIRGDKKLKDIEYGDMMLTDSGEYKPVVNIVEKFSSEWVRIKFEHADDIYASENHKFVVLRGSEVIEVKAMDLNVNDGFLKKSKRTTLGSSNNKIHYDVIRPIEVVRGGCYPPNQMKFIDIEVEGNHTFFFKVHSHKLIRGTCDFDDSYVLSHNCDGTHIQSIYIGWFLKFGKELFSSRKVARLMTPLVILWSDAKKTKIYKAFYSLGEYKDYESKHDISRYPKNYFKGLGSWSPEQFQHLFDSSPNGIEDYLQYFNIDKDGETYVDNWLNSEKTDVRKQYLRDYTLDIDKV